MYNDNMHMFYINEMINMYLLNCSNNDNFLKRTKRFYDIRLLNYCPSINQKYPSIKKKIKVYSFNDLNNIKEKNIEKIFRHPEHYLDSYFYLKK